MKCSLWAAAAWSAVATAQYVLPDPSGSLGGINNTELACQVLSFTFPSKVFFPGQANYTVQDHAYWSPTEYLSPACIFTPSSAIEVSIAVLVLGGLQSPFAVRGGGHMPIPGYNNINGGVLLGLSELNQAQLSSDSSYVSAGAGLVWEDVYSYLEPHGLAVLGGRVGNIGVPGLLLGGGISFYSNQYGFAADNVIAYEVVLANGQIVTANAQQYSDLFWALKGGGNSFGIVTRFDMLTYPSPAICAGITEIASSEKDAFLEAVADYGLYGSADPKSAVIPSIFMLGSDNITVYTSALFYDGTACTQPALANLSAIPSIENTYGPTTLAAYTKSASALIGPGTRQVFRAFSSLVSLEALNIIHDAFTQGVLDSIWDIPNIQASVAFQPVTKEFIQQGINKGGNPQGVDITKAPYFWMVENYSWHHSSYDSRIEDFAVQLTEQIKQKLAAAGQLANYEYMNDAGYGQEIFQNYGPGNLARLQTIRDIYDPLKVYTNLMPGGWKVANA